MSEEKQPDAPRLKAGTVVLVGRPNAGKSTLMNRLLTEKVAIVSDKPQTTRHRLVGILSGERGQIVFWDTPGLHKPLHRLNRKMVQVAQDALDTADLVCLLVDASERFGGGDRFVLDLVSKARGPKVVALNKVDKIAKPRLLPLIATYAEGDAFEEIVPVSALTGDGCEDLLEIFWQHLPAGEPVFDSALLTTHPERFLATERIREKVLERTRAELPFSTAVLLERWDEEPGRDLLRIYAAILVDRPGHKKILVGRQGQQIKSIGTAARLDLEEFLGRRVFLDLQVRLEPRWRENRQLLAEIDRDVEAALVGELE